MGKSQSKRLERKSINFRKELRTKGVRMFTTKEKQKEIVFSELNAKKVEHRKVTKLMNEYGQKNKPQPKSTRTTKRFKSKQMA